MSNTGPTGFTVSLERSRNEIFAQQRGECRTITAHTRVGGGTGSDHEGQTQRRRNMDELAAEPPGVVNPMGADIGNEPAEPVCIAGKR